MTHMLDIPFSTKEPIPDSSIITYSDVTLVCDDVGNIFMSVNGNKRVLDYTHDSREIHVYADYVLMAREFLMTTDLQWDIDVIFHPRTDASELGIICHISNAPSELELKWHFFNYMHRQLGAGYLYEVSNGVTVRTKTQVQAESKGMFTYDPRMMKLTEPEQEKLVAITCECIDEGGDQSYSRIAIDGQLKFKGYENNFEMSTVFPYHLVRAGLNETTPQFMKELGKMDTSDKNGTMIYRGRSNIAGGRQLMDHYLRRILGMDITELPIDGQNFSIYRHRVMIRNGLIL